MVSIPLDMAALKAVKRTLQLRFPEHKSAHLTEAIAAACGFNSHAALLASMRQGSSAAGSDYVLLDERSFSVRLSQLNSSTTRPPDFDLLAFPEAIGVVKTRSHGQAGSYGPPRQLAWRNAMVAVINEGIRRRLFTIRPGDNRWPGAATDGLSRGEGHAFELEVQGIPAIGYVSDAGYDELALHVAFWPTAEGRRWVVAANAGFLAGEVWAMGWLERREGAWLQVGAHPGGRATFRARRERLAGIAGLSIKPLGYADRGSFAL